MKGRDLLIKQLEDMESGSIIPIIDGDPTPAQKKLIKKLGIAKNLVPYFIAYHEEFMTPPFGCLNEGGPFWDDDLLAGIKEKFYIFFRPIASAALNGSYYLVIEPSYEYRTTVAIVNSETMVCNIYQEKAWNFYHEDIESLLSTLESYYEDIQLLLE